MLIYKPTAAESKKNSHIQNSNINYRKFPFGRSLEYGVFHYNSFGEGPYSPREIIMRARVAPILVRFRAALANRDSDLGQVTVDSSKYKDKMLTLPLLIEKIRPMVRDAYPNDNTILDYLYLNDMKIFDKGSQDNMQTICQGWIVRITTKILIPEVLALVTEWTLNLTEILNTKELKKDNVTEDRDNINDIVDELFDAIRKNYGDLYVDNSSDIRPLLRKFDPALLKPNETDSTKLASNQRELNIIPDQIASVDYPSLVPKNYFIVDNTANDCDALIFVSIETPGVVPTSAFRVPRGIISKVAVPDLGPRYPKKINGQFSDITFIGKILITVKKRK